MITALDRQKLGLHAPLTPAYRALAEFTLLAVGLSATVQPI